MKIWVKDNGKKGETRDQKQLEVGTAGMYNFDQNCLQRRENMIQKGLGSVVSRRS